jgi:hypothetical protein
MPNRLAFRWQKQTAKMPEPGICKKIKFHPGLWHFGILAFLRDGGRRPYKKVERRTRIEFLGLIDLKIKARDRKSGTHDTRTHTTIGNR